MSSKGLGSDSVYVGNLAMLVNGFPTQEIRIQMGLKQGDMLSPFHFLPVAKGLSGLNSKVVELVLLSGFRTWASNLIVSHLQYM